MNFEIIELEQGTLEWKKWRAAGIGASEASSILGENRFKSEGLLMQEKLAVKLDLPVNAAMQRGTDLEPIARAYYCDRRKTVVEPACIQSIEYPWMRASLDGINFDAKRVVEIKCGESAYKTTMQMGAPPTYYYAQLQHILAVTGFEMIDFWCYLPEKRPLLKEVRRHEWYIERLITAEEKFWRFIEPAVLKKLAEI